MLGQHSLEWAEGLFLMGLTPAVFQPRALQLQVPKQSANGDVMMALAVARLTAIRAVAPPSQSIVDLFPDHALLNLLQDQLAFRQGEAERFHLHCLPIDARHFVHLFVSGVVLYDQLQSEFRARPSFARAQVINTLQRGGYRF
jgi:hypothetical protein